MRRKLIALSLAVAFMFLAMSPISSQARFPPQRGAKFGPYVDRIVFNVITQDDQQVFALQDDEIDIIGDMVDPTFLKTLIDAENIDVVNVQRNGYGYAAINTHKYPYNITAFRRALAFALDKE